ncbi:6-phosphogluconolactonase [Luteimonas pelagia]
MPWVIHEHPDADAAAEALASSLVACCREALHARGSAWLALAGGRTPWPAYRRLATANLDWSRIALVPTDERCVPLDHPASNLRALAEAFAPATPLPVLVPLAPDDGDCVSAAALADAALSARSEPFDAVVLGMGTDGHTASLFPGAEALDAALDPAAGVDAMRIDPVPMPPDAPYVRVTLTVARLLRARSWHLLLSGEAKRRVLDEALAAADPRRHPVAAILHAPGVSAHVHWSP